MERLVAFGMITALILWGVLLGASATYYAYDHIILNNSRVANLAEPTTTYDAATKNYTDTKTKMTCTNYSVGATDCNSGRCYASKFTADKVCYDKSERTPYAVQYEYKYHGWSSAYRWRGNGWSSVSADQEDVGYGGSGRDGEGIYATSYITEVLCCGE